MDPLVFIITGEPRPWQRPRAVMRGRFPHFFTKPEIRDKTDDYIRQMRKQLKKGFKPLAGPLELEVRIYLARPKSLPKKIKHAAKKPDLDNLVKLFLDAMNGVVFVDDAQIIHFEAWKSFRPEEGATITVREVESEEKNDGRQKTLTLV